MQKLHLITRDDAGLSLAYILLTKENLFATNGFCGIIISTKDVLGDSFQEDLPADVRVLIHGKDWAKLCKPDVEFIRWDNGIIEVLKKKGLMDYIKVTTEEKVSKFPSLEHVIPIEYTSSVNVMGIDSTVLYNLGQALYPHSRKKGGMALFLKNSKDEHGCSSGAMDVRMIKEYDDITYKAVIMPVINA